MKGLRSERRCQSCGSIFLWFKQMLCSEPVRDARLGPWPRCPPGAVNARSASSAHAAAKKRREKPEPPMGTRMRKLRRPWTADEDALLRQLLEAGATFSLVAAKLKRTVGAVRSRATKLSVSSRQTRTRADSRYRI
jgi:hypothetical protein